MSSFAVFDDARYEVVAKKRILMSGWSGGVDFVLGVDMRVWVINEGGVVVME
jgi:hypothetical protein